MNSVDSSLRPDGREWIGPGTWLQDWGRGGRIGVITDIQEPDRGMAARVCVRWRPNSYENTSVLLVLEKLRGGRWEVDHAE